MPKMLVPSIPTSIVSHKSNTVRAQSPLNFALADKQN